MTGPSVTIVSTDAELVDAARRGDRAAFGLLYERYACVVHGIMLARVPFSDADDLVQEAFLLALRRLSTLRDTSAFGAWISAISRNCATQYYRDSPRHEGLTEEVTEGVQGDARVTADAAAILDVIKSLPEAYRETLIMRLVEGMTGPDIAARTGLTPGSVRVNLHRGMQQLRERLTQGARP